MKESITIIYYVRLCGKKVIIAFKKLNLFSSSEPIRKKKALCSYNFIKFAAIYTATTIKEVICEFEVALCAMGQIWVNEKRNLSMKRIKAPFNILCETFYKCGSQIKKWKNILKNVMWLSTYFLKHLAIFFWHSTVKLYIDAWNKQKTYKAREGEKANKHNIKQLLFQFGKWQFSKKS